MRRFVLSTTLLLACRPSPVSTVDASTEPSAPVAIASASAPVDAGMPPLEAPWIDEMALPDGGLAYVTPPVGAREPRPVIVAVHGAHDDAGLMCSAWRLVADVHPFVVCPAGRPTGERHRYVWSSGEHLAERVHQALDAVRAKYPGRVREDAPVVYVAFSQGANLAGTLLGREGKTFSRAVFTEGGYRTFEDDAKARAFVKGGGERVLFTCSQPGCAGSFATSRAAIARAGGLARIEYSGAHGHSMPPAVRESIHAAMPWIVEDLRGWESYATAPKLEGH